MAVPRIYHSASLQKNSRVEFSDAQMHYLRDVMRLREGDTITLFNGADGEWEAQITALHKKFSGAEAHRLLRPQAASPDIWLCFAPIKHARLETIVEKATELGASVLQPVMTKFTQASRVNTERMRAQVIEAAEQSERLDIPDVREPLALDKMLGGWPKDRTLLYGDESGEGATLAEVLNAIDGPLALLIGPEGGFSQDEHHMLRRLPFVRPMSMGPRILRADTAAIAALACILSARGDWNVKPRFKS